MPWDIAKSDLVDLGRERDVFSPDKVHFDFICLQYSACPAAYT